MKMLRKSTFVFLAGMLGLFAPSGVFCDQSRHEVVEKFSDAEILKIGENVYNTTGENTCLKCHRAGGLGEGWANCKDLRKPYDWNVFKGYGGYEAMEKDPETFYKNMYTTIEYLLANGGIRWNQGFKKDHPEIVLDWTKTPNKNNGQFDMMMWGTAQPITKKKIQEIQKGLAAEGKTLTDAEMKDLAVYSTLEYIKTFEEPRKKDDGTLYPKIHRSVKP